MMIMLLRITESWLTSSSRMNICGVSSAAILHGKMALGKGCRGDADLSEADHRMSTNLSLKKQTNLVEPTGTQRNPKEPTGTQRNPKEPTGTHRNQRYA